MSLCDTSSTHNRRVSRKSLQGFPYMCNLHNILVCDKVYEARILVGYHMCCIVLQYMMVDLESTGNPPTIFHIALKIDRLRSKGQTCIGDTPLTRCFKWGCDPLFDSHDWAKDPISSFYKVHKLKFEYVKCTTNSRDASITCFL